MLPSPSSAEPPMDSRNSGYCVCVGVPAALWWRFHGLVGLPLSGWPSTIAIGLGVCAGTFERMQMLTMYLRPFCADYVKTEQQRDVAQLGSSGSRDFAYPP